MLFGKKKKRRSTGTNTYNKNTTSTSRRRRRRSSGVLQYVAIAAAAVVLLLVIVFGVGVGKKVYQAGKIEDTLTEMTYACNNMDADALLAVIDPEVADPLRMWAALGGVNKNEVMGSIFTAICDLSGNVDMEQVLKSITYDVEDVEIEGEYARVTADCTMTVNGEEFARYVTCYLQNIRDKWYIMDMEMSVDGVN